jgi:hypothetical protein
MELMKEQTDRQDIVDNACYGLICELAKASDVRWDIEYISKVREAVQNVIVDQLHIMSEMEFYPYIEETEKQMSTKAKTLEELRQHTDESQHKAVIVSRLNLEMADKVRDLALSGVVKAVANMHLVASRHHRRSCGRRMVNG